MTYHSDDNNSPEAIDHGGAEQEVRFPELAELEDKIKRRLRSNQRFLERFMDEDFDEMDDEDSDIILDDDEPDITEEL